jgi:hypothetical protein
LMTVERIGSRCVPVGRGVSKPCAGSISPPGDHDVR